MFLALEPWGDTREGHQYMILFLSSNCISAIAIIKVTHDHLK